MTKDGIATNAKCVQLGKQFRPYVAVLLIVGSLATCPNTQLKCLLQKELDVSDINQRP